MTDNLTRCEVGVVVVAYKSDETIERCLTPLASGSYPVEIVVLDNSPTDSLREIVEQIAARWPLNYIWTGENVGFGVASNRGLVAVDAPFTLFLNPDAWIDADSLAICVDRLQRDETVGLLGCRLVRLDGTLDHACKRNMPTVRSALGHLTGRGGGSYKTANLGEMDEGNVGAINGAFMLGRTDEIRSLGGFDEDFWMYGEDLDLCWRMTETGKSILYFPRATAVHIKSASAGVIRPWRIHRAFYKSMEIFCRKHPQMYRPFPLPVTLVGIRTLMLATYVIGRLRGGRGN